MKVKLCSQLVIKICTPLVININGKQEELLPVVMNTPLPSVHPERWLRFLNSGGHKLPLRPDQAAQIQAFMRHHGTDAVLVDEISYTVGQDQLIQCSPRKGYELLVVDGYMADGWGFCGAFEVLFGNETITVRAASQYTVETPYRLPSVVSHRLATQEEAMEYKEELDRVYPGVYEDQPEPSRLYTLVYANTATGFLLLHGEGESLTFSCGYDCFKVTPDGVTPMGLSVM